MSKNNKAMVGNAADKKQVNDAKNKEKLSRDKELDDIRQVLSTPSGRRFYWGLLGFCGVFESSFTGNSQTFFLEGKRQVGLKMLADLNEAQPDAYVTMMNEAKGDENV